MLSDKTELDIDVLQTNDGINVSYEIKDFDNVLKLAQKKVAEFIPFVIQDDEQNKAAKEFRANCNKAKKNIADLRLSTIKSITGNFEEQCKQLEKIFDDKQKEIGVEINAYAASKKEEKTLVSTKTYSLKLTYNSEKLTQKIIEFCQKNNITVEEI